jgi:hypothetical protein
VRSAHREAVAPRYGTGLSTMALAVSTAVANTALTKKLVKIAIIATVGFVVAMVMVATMFVAASVQFLFGAPPSGGDTTSTGVLTITISSQQPAESAYARSHIPNTQTSPSVETYPILYGAATENGVCTLPWTILAGVTREESDFGTSTSAGVQSGANSAGAEGPFQFEPATFAAWANPIPNFVGATRPPSVYDAVDAAFAAARLLCANGIMTNPELALWTYNAGMVGVEVTMINGIPHYSFNDAPFRHSADNPLVYVTDVLHYAALYAGSSSAQESSIPVTIDTPTLSPSTVSNIRMRLATWMAILGSGGNCEALVNVSCPNVVPTVLARDGITLSSQPTTMAQELVSTTTAQQGDIVLFRADTDSYGVIGSVGPNPTVAIVNENTVSIVQMTTPINVGAHVGSLIISFIGDPL